MDNKVDSIASDRPPFNVRDVIDLDKLDSLLQSYSVTINTPVALLDLDGNILIAANWQDACTQFHRRNEKTLQRCTESDTALASQLEAGFKYNLYQCKNGLVDVATPVIIGGYHVLNIFTGQFFLESPDIDEFSKQADDAGFDKLRYLDAIAKVPVYSEQEIREKISFLVEMAQMIGEAGMLNLKLRQTNEELLRHKNHLAELVNEKTHELRAANDSLEEKVAERTRELNAAKEEAEIANRAKTVFLSRMSHELRTPLNATIGFAQLLQMDFDQRDSTAEERDAVEHIIDAGNHLLMLIDDIMDVVSFDGRDASIELEDISLQQLIEDSLVLVERRAGEEGVRLSTQDTQLYARSNKSRLKQVLVNLLTNAIKYNRPGGGVKVLVEAYGMDEVRIVVEDTGVGIVTPGDEDIFEPFVRLPYAESQAIEGTGIGLALAKYLVEKMGGRIGYETQLDHGSKFWVIIPQGLARFMSDEQAQSEAKRAMLNPGAKGSVLYIEDNLPSQQLISRVAALYPGIELHCVNTAEIGIELADSIRPSLILLDINLPGMDGIQAARILKRKSTLQDTAIVALSADAMPPLIDQAMAAGFDRYITKPIALSNIIEIFEGLDKGNLDWQQAPSALNSCSPLLGN